jgi:hypothetical protein
MTEMFPEAQSPLKSTIHSSEVQIMLTMDQKQQRTDIRNKWESAVLTPPTETITSAAIY